MPNYDYRCPECGIEFEAFAHIDARHDVRCPQCGKRADMQITGVQKHMPFKEGFFPHLDKTPVYASSKRQLKDECKKRDLFMPYAWD